MSLAWILVGVLIALLVALMTVGYLFLARLRLWK